MENKEVIEIEHIKHFEYMLDGADIFIWKFHNAPKQLREVSINGGDEDWLVVVEKEFYHNNYIGFLEEGMPGGIGICCVDIFSHGNYYILIGSHS